MQKGMQTLDANNPNQFVLASGRRMWTREITWAHVLVKFPQQF